MIQETEGPIGIEIVGLTEMEVAGRIVTGTAARIATHVTGDLTTEGQIEGQTAIPETRVQGRIGITETVETVEILATHVILEGHTAIPATHVTHIDQVETETGPQTGLDVPTVIEGTGTEITTERGIEMGEIDVIDATNEMDVSETLIDVLTVQTKTVQIDVRGTSPSTM